MEIHLLGALEILDDSGAQIALPGAKRRALLAALALRPGQVVSSERLVDELWGETAASNAANALQALVSKLRRSLPCDVVVTRAPGYVLELPLESIDIGRFEALALEGRKALSAGENESASALFREALCLWRGSALAEFTYEEFAQAEISRLSEEHASVFENRVEADLLAGRHGELVAELETAVTTSPLRERLRGQLMLALYRSGRQAEALRQFQEARRVLAEELGLEPGPELRRLEAAILTHDPALVVAPVVVTPPDTLGRPRQVLADELGIDPSLTLQALELAVLNQSPDLDAPAPAAGPDRPVASLPSGTVTFLFTDIEGSTQRVAEVGSEGFAAELRQHRAIIRDVVAANGGFEVRTEGDAFFLVFVRTGDALAAAAEIQKGHEGGSVRVRIGVHTGEPLVVEGDYVGLDVHRAARICSAAHGGQVLVSQSTRDLGEAELTDLGEFRLKDLTAPERLFQLGTDPFPPPRALGGGNLPVQPTALLGRHRELTDVVRLIGENRLVALTGPGGTGKTRLALQAAAEVADGYCDGVWWVPLAAVTDPEVVLPTMAEALGAGSDLPVWLPATS